MQIKIKRNGKMLIDFHIHAFNEKMAERAVAELEKISGLTPKTRGLITETRDRLSQWGVDFGALLPIATKPSQQKIINDWSAEQNCGNIIAFGSVHPDAEDVYDELERIKSLGLKGVKLHPDYQNFEIDEERLFPIYKKIAQLGLICVFHAGYDCYSPGHIHATPQMSKRVHEAVPELKMVLAHLGANRQWEQVDEVLAGLPGSIYFDSSMLAGYITEEQAYRIIKKHGADRILLGSDCPWSGTLENAELIKSLPLTVEEKELILYKNAQRLLGM